MPDVVQFDEAELPQPQNQHPDLEGLRVLVSAPFPDATLWEGTLEICTPTANGGTTVLDVSLEEDHLKMMEVAGTQGIAVVVRGLLDLDEELVVRSRLRALGLGRGDCWVPRGPITPYLSEHV